MQLDIIDQFPYVRHTEHHWSTHKTFNYQTVTINSIKKKTLKKNCRISLLAIVRLTLLEVIGP